MNLATLIAEMEAQARVPREPVADRITITGSRAIATSPEGSEASMPLETLLAKVAASRMNTAGMVLPDGIKTVLSEGPITVWVYESPPTVHRFLWIAPDSPAPFGQGTKYRTVRIALPYLVILAVFAVQPNGRVQLTSANECFFRIAPLKNLDELLLYPALLNCSRFEPPEGRPLSWICTQHLKPTPAMHDPNPNQSMAAGFDALRRTLLESGFNLSSEHHEFSSWFTPSCKVDPRIRTIEAWEQATARDPLFVLDVPWIPARNTVRQVAARIFQRLQAQTGIVRTASSLARIIFNHKTPPTPPAAVAP